MPTRKLYSCASGRMVRAAVVFLSCWFVGRIDGAKNIWIDTDPSIGPPWREVDDAYAMVFAFHSSEIRIAGISTTYGNAGLPRTTAVAREMTRRFGGTAGVTEGDVYSGARAARDFHESDASKALVRALRRERLTYVALGPLTNLASFLQAHRDVANRIERVIFVGGKSPGYEMTFGPSRSLRIHDANVFKDADAARIVMESRIPLVLAPVEVSSRLMLSSDDLRRFANDGGAAEYLRRRSGAWMWFWTKYVRERGGPLFDILAILRAVRPDFVGAEKRYAKLSASGDLLVTAERKPGSRPVRFCTAIERGAHEFVTQRLREPTTPCGR